MTNKCNQRNRISTTCNSRTNIIYLISSKRFSTQSFHFRFKPKVGSVGIRCKYFVYTHRLAELVSGEFQSSNNFKTKAYMAKCVTGEEGKSKVCPL